jgi:alkylation response protein AidB-like acyl-CoA dehydrogenase
VTTRSASEQAELAEIREELRAVARDLLGQAGVGAKPDWGQLAASGWLGLEVPAEFDGGDATFAGVAVIAEELGRAPANTPYLGAIVLGAGALLAAEAGDGRDELLTRVAAGQAVPVAVLTGPALPGIRPLTSGRTRAAGCG